MAAKKTAGSKKNAAHGGSAHQTRDTEMRDSAPVHDEDDEPWLMGQSLTMPPARAGMDQRWIRVAIRGIDDPTNWARKRREGWSPRKAETVSEDFPVPRIDQGKHAGFIGIEGMILCERPMAISNRRTRHFRQQTAKRTDAIHAALDRVNSQNRNPAFGPVQMASKGKLVYEDRSHLRDVPTQDD